ncbi:MAG: CoxG family protein [Acidimicrobiales bacterium]
MRFEKTVRVQATPDELWRLVDDIEAVAGCIPGMSDFSPQGDREFSALMTQRVGPVTARFRLNTRLTDLEPMRSVTAVSEGRDPDLDSSVRAEQRFEFRPVDGVTDVDISADIRMTGRVATFGQRIISSKAERVVVDALANVSTLLEGRRSRGG